MPRTVIPGVRYVDATGAIDFLCAAFGFVRHVVHVDDADPTLIHHAQLTFDGAMIMLGSARPSTAQARFGWKTPAEAGGVTTSLYVYVADPDAHCARARTAGAEVIDEPHDNDGYPGRGYGVRDPEGYVWVFGSYDPWAD